MGKQNSSISKSLAQTVRKSANTLNKLSAGCRTSDAPVRCNDESSTNRTKNSTQVCKIAWKLREPISIHQRRQHTDFSFDQSNSIADSTPTLPRRLPSIQTALVDDNEVHNTHVGSEMACQRNAVFNDKPIQPIRTSSFWETFQSIKSVDKPPSYQRKGSYTALESFGSISINGKTAFVSKDNQKQPLPTFLALSNPSSIHASKNTQPHIRDAQETWQCIQRDFYRPVSCPQCGSELTCIRDLDQVLCPCCDTFSTVEGIRGGGGGGGGGGIGLTVSDLKYYETAAQSQFTL